MNTKYNKIKQNQKLQAKFFRLFQIFYPVRKQAYKLELFKKWKIHKVFYLLFLKQNIIKKKQVDINAIELVASNDKKKYKVKAICNNAIYIRESVDYLLELYYIIFKKNYLKKENI